MQRAMWCRWQNGRPLHHFCSSREFGRDERALHPRDHLSPAATTTHAQRESGGTYAAL